MKTFTILFISITFFSCKQSEVVDEIITIENKENIIEVDSIGRNKRNKEMELFNIAMQGRKELDSISINQDLNQQFPSCEYSKVVLYKLNGNHNNSGAESVFNLRTEQSKELSKSEVAEFLDLLNNTHSFGNTIAACFEPRTRLVFYNEEGNPCSYLSLCLTCNNIASEPPLNYSDNQRRGFSVESRKELHKILENWGFPAHNYSPLFDDNELYAKYLREEGLTENEIIKEIEQYGNNK